MKECSESDEGLHSAGGKWGQVSEAPAALFQWFFYSWLSAGSCFHHMFLSYLYPTLEITKPLGVFPAYFCLTLGISKPHSGCFHHLFLSYLSYSGNNDATGCFHYLFLSYSGNIDATFWLFSPPISVLLWKYRRRCQFSPPISLLFLSSGNIDNTFWLKWQTR